MHAKTMVFLGLRCKYLECDVHVNGQRKNINDCYNLTKYNYLDLTD